MEPTPNGGHPPTTHLSLYVVTYDHILDLVQELNQRHQRSGCHGGAFDELGQQKLVHPLTQQEGRQFNNTHHSTPTAVHLPSQQFHFCLKNTGIFHHPGHQAI